MFTRFIALALVAFSCLSFAPVASAQAYGTCAYVNPGNGRPGFWNCPQQVQPMQQVIIRDVSQVGGNPIYANGGGMPVGGFSSCAMIGGLAGGTLGSLTDHHRGQAVILGAIIGGVVGNWACSPPVAQQRVVTQQVAQRQPAAQADARLAGLTPAQIPDEEPRLCSEGKTWMKLNYPGHSMHNKGVCLPDGDPHRF